MSKHLVHLAQPLPASHGEQLSRRLYYLAPGITGFTLVRDGDTIVAVEIITDAETDAAVLARKVNAVNSAEVVPQRMLAAEQVWRSPHPDRRAAGVFAELTRRGITHRMGDGGIATGPVFNAVLDALDAMVLRIAADEFAAVQYRYPTLVETSALCRGGYLSSFPQLLMTAGRVVVDLDAYRGFVDELADGAEPGDLLNRYSEHSGYCLPPTMCFHTYHHLSGATLAGSARTVTARGRSFRFESRYSRSLERLWDFTIREIVFIGDAPTVARDRERFLRAVCELVTELGLAGGVVSADDPFFAGTAVSRRAFAQRLRHLKYELRLPAEDDRTISVASFNLHGTTFGESYGIRLPDGEVASTACVGVGLERFAFALFCHYGADVRHWPSGVCAGLGIDQERLGEW